MTQPTLTTGLNIGAAVTAALFWFISATSKAPAVEDTYATGPREATP
jgi:hypothetical protein